jgi:hypothetical protein
MTRNEMTSLGKTVDEDKNTVESDRDRQVCDKVEPNGTERTVRDRKWL